MSPATRRLPVVDAIDASSVSVYSLISETLRSYTEAFGGTLEITAVIEGKRFPLSVGYGKAINDPAIERPVQFPSGAVEREKLN